MQIVPFDGWVAREEKLLFYPRNANSAGVNSAGTAWSWSAYGQIVASTSEDFTPIVLCAKVKVVALTATTQTLHIEYEVATGGAGSEATLGTFNYATDKGIVSPGAGTQCSISVTLNLPFAPKTIPSGTRIAHRIRISQADTEAVIQFAGYIGGFAGGNVSAGIPMYNQMAHLRGIHKAISKNTPSGSGLSLTASSFPNYGSWVEVITSAASNLLFRSINKADVVTLGASHYIEIGVGGAGSEVTIGRLAFPQNLASQSCTQYFPRPLLIKAGERVAARATGQTTAFETTYNYEQL